MLVVTVSVFLAYNANKGLPFVPTYDLNVHVPSGADLVVGNDVRVGGTRVGAVDSIKPVRDKAVRGLMKSDGNDQRDDPDRNVVE